MRLDRKNHILGKISNDVFLKKYWQKKPLLIRDAIKNFKSPITEKDLFRIAQNENAISRLIEFKRRCFTSAATRAVSRSGSIRSYCQSSQCACNRPRSRSCCWKRASRPCTVSASATITGMRVAQASDSRFTESGETTTRLAQPSRPP